MKFVLPIIGSIVATIMGAFVLSTVWGWYMVPLGLTAISMLNAYGIMLISSCLIIPAVAVLSPHNQNEDTTISLLSSQFGMIAGYGVTLFGGFIVLSIFG